MKKLEDHLAEIKTDMVAVCLEYADNQAEEIFIYGSYEPNMYAFDVFYKINGQFVHRDQLNNAVQQSGLQKHEYDVSDTRQLAILKIGRENLKAIRKKCEEYNREMPTEIKLYYDVKKNQLKGQSKYELMYSHNDELLPSDIFDAWFEEVKNQETE
ncbi:DUF600 domain-containing protein [Bhargavaea massiliensis]|uniref:DUF600 domain-containing protein n=1 Tax=Bhargavaea massiliensis TaxID=2697500 RepID=UPI001BCB1F6A|nr:DUF600 domain-containing protein [Bhargavaea massiliensis]